MPADVQPNDFRFTVVDLFIGTAVTPNSATTFLNYFTVLGRDGVSEEDEVIFERPGYCKGPSPWSWDGNAKPLCKVELTDGSIDDCPADLHVEFANSYPGGGVMSGDAAQEETLFLVKPELMVAMALNNRMVDEEVVAISGAVKCARPLSPQFYAKRLVYSPDSAARCLKRPRYWTISFVGTPSRAVLDRALSLKETTMVVAKAHHRRWLRSMRFGEVARQ